MTASKSEPASAPLQARNAWRISLVALVVCTAYVVYLFTLAVQIGTVERLRAALMISGLVVMAGVSAWLSRRGRSTLGMVLLLGWLYAAVLESPTRQSGQGVMLGAIAILMTFIVATQTLDRRWSLRMLVASILCAGGAVLLDAYGPADRPYYGLGGPALVATVCMVIFLLIIAREFQTYPLRTKLIIAFLTVSLFSVAAVALYAENTIRLTLQDQVSAQLLNIARLQGTTVGDQLAKEVEVLRVLALDNEIRAQADAANAGYQGTPDEILKAIQALDLQWVTAVNTNNNALPLIRAQLDNPLAAHLREYRQTYPENVEVFVTDRHGALIGATNRTSDYYQADEAWWQAAFNNGQGAVYLSQPDFDASSNSFSIDLGLPIYDREGTNIIGIIRSTVDMTAIVDLLARPESTQAGQIELLLPDNTFLQAGGSQPAPEGVVGALPATSVKASEVNWAGVPNFAASMPVRATSAALAQAIDQLNWHIIAHQASSEILAPVEAQAGTLILVMAIVAAIASAASVGMSQVLVRPILALTAVATKVSQGDLTPQATIETQDEIGVLAATFNSMTAQLRSTVSVLEERVQERTAQLRGSSEVGRAAASILDTDQLLGEVVNLISNHFGFYYAAVFLVDDAGAWAMLREATGDAGRALKERGHRLEVGGQSMVGTVVRTKKSRIALDVGTEAVRFANPLLPETRSEITLPLVVGQQVLGALDVQSVQAAAFDEAFAAVLQAMADQIAIALSNSLQFQAAQAALQVAHEMNDASQAITRAETGSQVLTGLVEYGLPDAEQAVLVSYGPNDEQGNLAYYEVTASWSRQPDNLLILPQTRFDPDQLPFLQLIEPGQPLLLTRAQEDDETAMHQEVLEIWQAQALGGFAC